MTLQALKMKINKYLKFLPNEHDGSLEQLSVALILKHYQIELEKLPRSKEQERLTKTITIALLRNLRSPPSDILKYYSQQLLLNSITNNDSELLEALTALKPEVVNTLFPRQDTIHRNDSALILAVTHVPPRLDLIKLLVQVKELAIDYSPFRTALDEAVAIGNLEIVNILLEAEATATQKTFQIACSTGHLAIAKELVKANNHEPFNYNDALLASIEFGYLPIIRYLVNELKADVNYVEEFSLGKYKQTLTPLSLAIQHKQDSIALFLKEAGAKGEYKSQAVQDKKSDERKESQVSSQATNSDNKLRFFKLNHSIQQGELQDLLGDYLKDRTKKVDDNGETKLYLYSYIPEFFQKSFVEKQEAVAALTQALNGKPVDLASHLSTLRNGNLGNKLRAFVKQGRANFIVGCEVDTVSDFVAALDAKVNQKIISPK
jgi:hypothetical protein